MKMKGPERSAYEPPVSEVEAAALASDLQQLMEHPAWPAFREALKAKRILCRERAMEQGPEMMLYWKGYVDGLTGAEGLPIEVVQIAVENAKVEDPRKLAGRIAPRGPMGDDGSPTFD